MQLVSSEKGCSALDNPSLCTVFRVGICMHQSQYQINILGREGDSVHHHSEPRAEAESRVSCSLQALFIDRFFLDSQRPPLPVG